MTATVRSTENSDPKSAMYRKESGASVLHRTACQTAEKNFQKKSELGLVEDVEIGHVVELVVAASEALAIDELSREGCVLAGLTPENVLEAAICVKEARRDLLVDDFCCQSDELYQIDSLSDLDDTIMTDAFVDAGLSLLDCENGRGCDSFTFSVNDTLELENHNIQSLPRDEKLLADISLAVNNSYMPCSFDEIVHDPSMEAPNIPPVVKRIPKIIPQPFVGQTSFLSESADIALDQNSFLPIHEGVKNTESQPSVNFEGVVVNFEEGTSVSQETRCINLSLSDFLCSVVPCSLPSETALPHFVHNQNGVYGNINVPMSKPRMENITAPDLDVGSELVAIKSILFVGNARTILEGPDLVYAESTHMDSNAQSCNDNAPEAPVRRHASSPRIYSTKVTIHGSIGDDGKLFSRNFAPSELKASSDFLPSSEFICRVDKSWENHRKSCATEVPIEEINVLTKEGAKMHNHASLSALNSGIRSRVQGSELFLDTVIGDQNQIQAAAEETRMVPSQTNNLLNTKLRTKRPTILQNLTRKRVCFSDFEFDLQQNKDPGHPPSSSKAIKRSTCSNPRTTSQSPGWKSSFGSPVKDAKGLIFRGVEFLLTGFSRRKESAIMRMLKKHGGVVLSEIPIPMTSREYRLLRLRLHQLPTVISSKKVQTTKFLYGCAVNTLVLELKWLTNSIAEGSVLPPEKYMILPHQTGFKNMTSKKLLSDANYKRIFENVGIFLHGTCKFYTKFSTIIKHGGGEVFKTLQRLFNKLDAKMISMGVIVVEDNSRALRLLKHCAYERNIPLMPGSWIGKSLILGEVLPYGEDRNVTSPKNTPEVTIPSDWCEEI